MSSSRKRQEKILEGLRAIETDKKSERDKANALSQFINARISNAKSAREEWKKNIAKHEEHLGELYKKRQRLLATQAQNPRQRELSDEIDSQIVIIDQKIAAEQQVINQGNIKISDLSTQLAELKEELDDTIGIRNQIIADIALIEVHIERVEKKPSSKVLDAAQRILDSFE
jgi:chromosome segregation ATPase